MVGRLVSRLVATRARDAQGEQLEGIALLNNAETSSGHKGEVARAKHSAEQVARLQDNPRATLLTG
jgi:hypothetical protein